MFSMKSSNPQVMILAYRLLVAEMMTLGWDYPLHLGVTEAGEGEDGRTLGAACGPFVAGAQAGRATAKKVTGTFSRRPNSIRVRTAHTTRRSTRIRSRPSRP